MLILPYVADGDTFIFADDDILIISWGSVAAVNKINNVYVFYNKRRGDNFFSPELPKMYQLNHYNSPSFVIQSVKKQNYFLKNLNRAKKTSIKNWRIFILGDRRIRQLSRVCQKTTKSMKINPCEN